MATPINIIWIAIVLLTGLMCMSKSTQDDRSNGRDILAEAGADAVPCGATDAELAQKFSPKKIRTLRQEYAKFRFRRFYTHPTFRWLTAFEFDGQLSDLWGEEFMTECAINVECFT